VKLALRTAVIASLAVLMQACSPPATESEESARVAIDAGAGIEITGRLSEAPGEVLSPIMLKAMRAAFPNADPTTGVDLTPVEGFSAPRSRPVLLLGTPEAPILLVGTEEDPEFASHAQVGRLSAYYLAAASDGSFGVTRRFENFTSGTSFGGLGDIESFARVSEPTFIHTVGWAGMGCSNLLVSLFQLTSSGPQIVLDGELIEYEWSELDVAGTRIVGLFVDAPTLGDLAIRFTGSRVDGGVRTPIDETVIYRRAGGVFAPTSGVNPIDGC
jgi:hypothetical protein